MTRAPRSTAEGNNRRMAVRSRYGHIATVGGCCDDPGAGSGCCQGTSESHAGSSCGCSLELGYSQKELDGLPSGADLGLGCGNPTGLASLQRAEVVLDLGSGGGIDCFLASRKVGPRGRVIGVDMTPEMVGKARLSARDPRYRNVEFRLGEIEHLPVADRSVDVVISNCVINLAPDKEAVYREAFRALRPGGRLAISDVVATRPISARDRADRALWASCSSGALDVKTVRGLLRKAGFTKVTIDVDRPVKTPTSLQGQATLGVVSARIVASKPAG